MTPESTSQETKTLQRGTGKSRYLYRQLADILNADIINGLLVPGDMLPSMDELAKRFQINKATVRQAITELAAAGIVYSIPAKGTFVADRLPETKTSKRRSLSIGWISSVCFQGRTGRYHTEIMDAARDALQKICGNLVILPMSGIPTSSFCQLIGDAQLDGAILMGPFANEPLHQLLGGRLPCVLVDDRIRGVDVDTILNNNYLGGYEAITHLIELGHKRFAFVAGPEESQASKDRLEGAFDALDEAKIPRSEATVIHSDFTPEGGYLSLLEIAGKPPVPTGLFFFNDEMAFGAYRALYEHTTLRVPQDVSFVGFDNVSWAAMTHPPLTTVHVEKGKIGQEAVRRLDLVMKDKNHEPSTVIIPTRLEVRNSTAKPPA